jgi:hypothetical protein
MMLVLATHRYSGSAHAVDKQRALARIVVYIYYVQAVICSVVVYKQYCCVYYKHNYYSVRT